MRYVVGLAFNAEHNRVLLQLKIKGPQYTRGWLNGPGGKVEQYPTPEDLRYESFNGAMIREFFEETGIRSQQDDWLKFHYERHPSGTELHFYTTDKLDIVTARTTTPEHNVIVELGVMRDAGWVYPKGYLWCPTDEGYSMKEAQEHINVQVKPRGGLIYNMPYLIPMALTYLEYPEHRYLEG